MMNKSANNGAVSNEDAVARSEETQSGDEGVFNVQGRCGVLGSGECAALRKSAFGLVLSLDDVP